MKIESSRSSFRKTSRASAACFSEGRGRKGENKTAFATGLFSEGWSRPGYRWRSAPWRSHHADLSFADADTVGTRLLSQRSHSVRAVCSDFRKIQQRPFFMQCELRATRNQQIL